MKRLSVVVILLGLCLAWPAYAQKRAFTLEDIYRVASIGGLQVSPDGARAAYTVTTSDLPRAKRATHIWLMDLSTGRTRQVTRGDSSESELPKRSWKIATSAESNCQHYDCS